MPIASTCPEGMMDLARWLEGHPRAARYLTGPALLYALACLFVDWLAGWHPRAEDEPCP
jgi:hypothetical protein